MRRLYGPRARQSQAGNHLLSRAAQPCPPKSATDPFARMKARNDGNGTLSSPLSMTHGRYPVQFGVEPMAAVVTNPALQFAIASWTDRQMRVACTDGELEMFKIAIVLM